MTAWIDPTSPADGARAWQLGDAHVHARRASGDWWSVTRSWREAPVAVRGGPHVGVTLADGHTVAHLVDPLWLAPGEQADLWLTWPLVVVVAGPSGAVVDEHRPHVGRTLLGRVESGEVLPAVRCRALDGPLTARAPTLAALQATLRNRGASPVVMRRFPVAEPALTLARGDGTFVAGHVEVSVHDGGAAESRVLDPSLPAGFAPLPKGPQDRGFPLKLDWLLDATRRSTEFQL